MKRLYAMPLALIVLASLLFGCGKKEEEATGTPATPPAGATSTEKPGGKQQMQAGSAGVNNGATGNYGSKGSK